MSLLTTVFRVVWVSLHIRFHMYLHTVHNYMQENMMSSRRDETRPLDAGCRHLLEHAPIVLAFLLAISGMSIAHEHRILLFKTIRLF